jgi:hypothetical protein
VTNAKDGKNDDAKDNQSGKNTLVEIKRDGVKLRDPCQKQTEQAPPPKK